MGRRNMKHKRQATRRRKRLTNHVCETNLNKADNGGLQRYHRHRFTWDDCRRARHSSYMADRSWKQHRKTQYKEVTAMKVEGFISRIISEVRRTHPTYTPDVHIDGTLRWFLKGSEPKVKQEWVDKPLVTLTADSQAVRFKDTTYSSRMVTLMASTITDIINDRKVDT